MVVNRLELENFRNYKKSCVDFSDGINVIVGGNANGKTNMLEAVYYLTGGRSFRAKTDRELIRFGEENAAVSAEIFSQGRNQKLKAELSALRKKTVYVNDKKIKTNAELSGKLTAVLFCPDDLNIIRSSPVYRRRLIDNCLCQLRPKYSSALSEYRKLYENKTRILKDCDEDMFSVLEDFDTRMCEISAVLIYYRARFVKLLDEYASEIHMNFSGGKEKLNIGYKTVKTIENTFAKPSELLKPLKEHMKAHRQAEVSAKRCLSGAHKDDLEIHINGIDAKNYASQGQTRTAAISVKLAERNIHSVDTGEYPVLLLDDVLSELDAERQDFILNRINEGQVLITCCEDQSISKKTGGKVLSIKNGEVF